MIVVWIARRVEILMVAAITFSVILFVLAVLAGDGPRIIAYPVVAVAFLAIRYGARAVRQPLRLAASTTAGIALPHAAQMRGTKYRSRVFMTRETSSRSQSFAASGGRGRCGEIPSCQNRRHWSSQE